jgi:peroxiredoxin Q/BCP
LFAKKNRLTFNLLADIKQEVRNSFGVPRSLFGLISGRVTYIIGLKGEIRGIYNSMTDATGHITKALEMVKTI